MVLSTCTWGSESCGGSSLEALRPGEELASCDLHETCIYIGDFCIECDNATPGISAIERIPEPMCSMTCRLHPSHLLQIDCIESLWSYRLAPLGFLAA